MKSIEYKSQFVALLHAAFPKGLPEGADNMKLSVNGTTFVFRFDPSDYSSQKKVKNINGKNTKTFDELLTELDVSFLKKTRISIEDVEEPKV